jgi:hypothetical protein
MTYADATFYVGVHFAGDDSRDLSTPVDPRQHTMGIEVLCKLIGISYNYKFILFNRFYFAK